MPLFVLIGLAAGLACAALFASAQFGGIGGRFLLQFLVPLPAFLAGLGWGPGAALIAAVSAAAGTSLLLEAKDGLLILVSQGLPAAYLCYLAQLSRTVTPGPNAPTADPTVEWYPIGRLVAT